jgi:hypothetical protein
VLIILRAYGGSAILYIFYLEVLEKIKLLAKEGANNPAMSKILYEPL